MSIHIRLIDPPEYYTNLDTVHGQIEFFLSKPESIGAIVVKLEGEANTTLTVPPPDNVTDWTYRNVPLGDPACTAKDAPHPCPSPGTELKENHKILYQVSQVYPPRKMGDATNAHPPAASTLPQGQHTFPFQFYLPFNNACADPDALVRSGGLVDFDGNTDGVTTSSLGRFGTSAAGIRVMNGTKQQQLRHVKQSLPPSFSAPAGQAEIRYFVKVTVQRPSLFRENWRHQISFRFLPLEPPRALPTTRETFVRRPFTFAERSQPSATPPALFQTKTSRLSAFFGRHRSYDHLANARYTTAPGDELTVAAPTPGEWAAVNDDGLEIGDIARAAPLKDGLAPSIQISALLPFPAVLTCQQPVPLRLTARKLVPSREVVYLQGFEVRLVGTTRLVAQDLCCVKKTSWVITARSDLALVACTADGPVGSEMELPDGLWYAHPLPSGVMPSFRTCNASRTYELELRLTLSWGMGPTASSTSSLSLSLSQPSDSARPTRQSKKERKAALKALQAQPVRPPAPSMKLPLNFEAVEVYSGVKPSDMLAAAATRQRERREREEEERRQQEEIEEERRRKQEREEERWQQHQQQQQQQQLNGQSHELYANGHAWPPEIATHPTHPTELPVVPPRIPVNARQNTIRRRPVPQQYRPQQPQLQQQQQQKRQVIQQHPVRNGSMSMSSSSPAAPVSSATPQYSSQQGGDFDPLYPPQLVAGEETPGRTTASAAGYTDENRHEGHNRHDSFDSYDSYDAYDAPPPTYDEAMTSVLDLGGGIGSERPAFSGESPAQRIYE